MLLAPTIAYTCLQGLPTCQNKPFHVLQASLEGPPHVVMQAQILQTLFHMLMNDDTCLNEPYGGTCASTSPHRGTRVSTCHKNTPTCLDVLYNSSHIKHAWQGVAMHETISTYLHMLVTHRLPAFTLVVFMNYPQMDQVIYMGLDLVYGS